MPQVSKRRLEPQVKKDLNDSFAFLIKEIRSKDEVEMFLNSVLTETERLMLSKRVVAAFLLQHGIEEQKISEMLKLTPATVSRLKLWILTRKKGFDIVFNKLEKERRNSIAKDVLLKLLKYAVSTAGGRPPKIF